ncbi:acetyl-CoA acetyltransferase [Sphingosinicella microcystinivorans]|uniref:Acetyl-CoA acetyltransferase n=1 Tax=Sphingosinicella microcystinivorans TaxID=335406 RepID=A0AAD1FZX1_SPHMI|nr:acetyl-CoA acetyltransferase [Sphingosinicella microcystinivorans]RKS85428.1 acetyl-CoA acetyltransferase [Sphingosinicella microcystinivorans]BBE33282.1 thiolase [Sphingosinicella microcystinivorans]
MTGIAGSVRGKAAMVSAATAGIGKVGPNRSFMEIAALASVAALGRCGLSVKDVDGLFGVSMSRLMWGVDFAEYLGIDPSYCEGTQLGGSSFEAHCLNAALALEAGLCNVALIAFGATTRSGRGPWPQVREPDPYLDAYRAEGLHTYAMATQRHMHEFGTTREQLSEVAVAARQWAKLNPEAFMRDDLSLADVSQSRLVSSPLRLGDCCLITDGAAAIVMTRADRARDIAARPAYLLGAAMALDGTNPALRPSLTTTVAAQSGARAFGMAGMRPRDIDVVQLYDAFTINVIMFLEDLGFCAKGEGGSYVDNGALAPGGRLAVNTNGGGLSCVHPGMYGAFMLAEVFEQLAGTAGERQIQSAKTAICHGNGGNFSTQVTTVWGTEETL